MELRGVGMRFSAIMALVLTMSSQATAGDLLPLNDGLYVTDARLCDMTLEEITFAYGDRVASWTRLLEGTSISTYESTCNTRQIDANGDQVSFNVLCTGEGEEWEEAWTFEIPNKDSFIEDGGRGGSFLRCASQLAADPNVPSTADLLVSWNTANASCRGSSDPDIYVPACAKRDVYDEQLIQRGWCYTQDNWSEESMWQVCQSELQQ